MTWWRNMRLRRRLMLVIQLTSAIALLVATLAFLGYIWFDVRASMANDLTVLADVLANNSTAALTFSDTAAGRETLQALRARPHVLRADLYDRNGTPFAAYSADAREPLPPDSDGVHFGENSVKVVRPIIFNNKRIGTLSIESSLQPLYERLRMFGLAGLIVMLLAILISYTLSAVLQRSISNPILALANTAQRITESQDYSMRAEKLSEDEIGRLAGIFNQMLDGIQRTETALQHEITEHQRAEAEVRRHRDHLEELVSARTGALQSVNDRLKQASQALARSNAELEQFAYVASHDLREPLRTITGFVQILQGRLKSKLEPENERYMGFIVSGALRMDALITGLLQYARLETHAQPFQPTDCGTVLDVALENLRATIQETGATITYDRPLPVIRGDVTQLTQLFQNLIANGIKFHRSDEPPKIHVAVTQKNHDWIFSVRDNGIGIDAQYHKRIFVIFERLHPMDKYPGTGIGLAVCRKIIERHDGRIWLESELGKGTTFFFSIPALSNGA